MATLQTYSDQQVTEMIGEVETAIEALLKSETSFAPSQEGNGGLNKGAAPHDTPSAPPKTSSGSPSAPTPRSASGSAHGQSGTAEGLGKDEPSASAAPTSEGSASASPAEGSASAGGPPEAASPSPSPSADPASAGDPAAQQPEAPPTKEELDAAYGQLSAPELEMHIQCATQALAAKQAQMGGGMGMPGAGPSPSPSPSPAAPPSPSASPMPAPGAAPLPADQSPPLAPDATMALKSENTALRGRVDELQKSMEAFLEGIKGMVTPRGQAPQGPQIIAVKPAAPAQPVAAPAPMQKAVTAFDAIPEAPRGPAMQLTKSEIGEALKTVVHKELTKSERQLINRWYRGEASDQEVSHLVKK